MKLLPKLHSLVSDTLQDVFSMQEGLHKASLYVLSDDELTEFVRYSDSHSITVVRSDNTDITTASPWKVLNDVATINETLCVSECQSVVDPYIQSNNINSFVCAPVCQWESTQLFLWSDSTLKTVTFSAYDEQKISRWAEDFQSTINNLSESENTSVVDAVSVLLDNKESVSTLPNSQNVADFGVKTLAESAVRIEGLEAVETHLRIYERAVKATNSGVTITDARLQDYPIIYSNPAFEKMTGYSFAETVGRNARFLQGDENEQVALQVVREALDKGTHCKVTLRNYKKDGSLFWNELTLSPIIDSDGFLTHYIGIQNDITARVEAERKLLDAKERELKVPKLLAQAASLANVVGWQFDLNSGQMLVVGNIYGLIHQKDENIMTPSHLFDCVLPSHAESAVDNLDSALAGDIELNRVLPVCVDNGQEKRIHYIAKLFPTGVSRDGGPCLAGTLQDVTDFTSTFVE
ncbi:hypothetical protein A9Q81_03740 [Gammaproteobacteria bacterium 42_54_T18]|nr:hypothetical protein A9Q81_03740 [Gammaproteobacteria bacterium 42_54_T18]